VALAIPVAPRLAATAPAPEVGPLVMATLLQIAVGLALGFVVQLMFAAVQAAGELIDLFAGFTIAATYDPFTSANQAVFGRLYFLLAMALLFASDGHVLLVHGFLTSFDAGAVAAAGHAGHRRRADRPAEHLLPVRAGDRCAAARGAVPREVTMGLLSKAAPQMNVFTLGFPIKILLSLGLVGLALPLLPDAVERC
jgi:flagellar biosynthetic protein FliR